MTPAGDRIEIPGSSRNFASRSSAMIRLLLVALASIAFAGCSDNSDRDIQKNDTLKRQLVDKSPKVDKTLRRKLAPAGISRHTT